MENPFEVLDRRLGALESLLIELKHQQEHSNALLSPKEAAHEAGLHINTIRNLMKSGQLEITYLGSIKRIARKELHKVKSKNKAR